MEAFLVAVIWTASSAIAGAFLGPWMKRHRQRTSVAYRPPLEP